jgi:hypothetical protein
LSPVIAITDYGLPVMAITGLFLPVIAITGHFYYRLLILPVIFITG